VSGCFDSGDFGLIDFVPNDLEYMVSARVSALLLWVVDLVKAGAHHLL
jgi:hypothetical protein